MAHISATRLRLRSLLFLPAFVRDNERVVAQLTHSPGFRGGALIIEKRMTFWTWSAWDSPEAMRAFRDTGAHRAVMPKLLDWCDEASVAFWQGEAPADFHEVHARMLEGRPSRVRKPAKAHVERRIPPPKPWFPARPLTPVDSL